MDKKKVATELGLKIRMLRLNKGLTMADFANICDMEYIQLSRIELGKINTTFYQIKKIANSLNITVGQMFNEIDNVESSNHLNGEYSKNPKE